MNESDSMNDDINSLRWRAHPNTGKALGEDGGSVGGHRAGGREEVRQLREARPVHRQGPGTTNSGPHFKQCARTLYSMRRGSASCWSSDRPRPRAPSELHTRMYTSAFIHVHSVAQLKPTQQLQRYPTLNACFVATCTSSHLTAPLNMVGKENLRGQLSRSYADTAYETHSVP
jgi:hypothetical protein